MRQDSQAFAVDEDEEEEDDGDDDISERRYGYLGNGVSSECENTFWKRCPDFS